MAAVLRNLRIDMFFVMLLVNFCFTSTYCQNIKISMLVTESSGHPLSNAAITVNSKKLKADSLGRLVFSQLPGLSHISVSAIGHYGKESVMALQTDTLLVIVLDIRESLLSGVTVRASRNVYHNQMSAQAISIAQIKRMPVLLGEVDPLKTITLLPGVKSGGDAGAGVYVRGGGPDQNLVLLDGITVYNPNHLLGFFSIFNGDAVKGIEVIKGGMPAEYGGRLSSVINVSTREGAKDSLKGNGGIGLISSRLSLEGPLVKNKSSFIISGRRTYIDQVASVVAKSRIGGNGYYFYDLNGKADYIIDSSNQLYFTFYKGQDQFSYQDKIDPGRERVFVVSWGNTIAGLTWKQQVSKKLQQEFAVTYNAFSLNSHIEYGISGFTFTSGLRDFQVRNDWKLKSAEWLKWKWGVQYTLHRFKPGAGETTAGTQQFAAPISNQHAREAAAYLSTDINVTRKLSVIAGFRYSYFNQVGPTERVVYGNDGVPTGMTERFGKGESIALYHYPEPRLSVLYKLDGQSSIKGSYTRMVQYLHLATTSAATFPSDLWTPVSRRIRPGISEQLAAGYYRDFTSGMWEISAEAYYKTMGNQLEFRPGAQLLLNQNIENEMIFGSGEAYGLELFIQKKRGRLTGWLGYTISRAERQFDALNSGKPYPYRYDRTHDMSLVASYRLNKKWDFSAVFVYGTGNALTLPTGGFGYYAGYNAANQTPVFTSLQQYGKINDYRMPAYHRMDIAFTYTRKPDTKRRVKGNWVFSLNNLYNRYNPYFIYMDYDAAEQKVTGKQVLLFPLIPGITYNFKF